MRSAGAVVVAVALIAAAASGAVLVLFTTLVFDALGFHPIALDYMYGRVSRGDLESMIITGQSFTAAEISHLDDVAALLGLLSRVFLAAAAAIIIAAFMAPGVLRRAATLAVAGIAAIGAAIVASYAVLGFYTVGVFFHEIVFPQGNWRFAFESLIIRLYGSDVMVTGAAFAISVAVGGLVAAFALTRFLKSERR